MSVHLRQGGHESVVVVKRGSTVSIKNNSIIGAIHIRTLQPRAAYHHSQVNIIHYSQQVICIAFLWLLWPFGLQQDHS